MLRRAFLQGVGVSSAAALGAGGRRQPKDQKQRYQRLRYVNAFNVSIILEIPDPPMDGYTPPPKIAFTQNGNGTEYEFILQGNV